MQVQKKEKRRLNPLWLIPPLLVVICCCGLLLLFQGRVPDFAAPYVDPIINPIIEQVEKVLPGLQENLQPGEVSCDDLRIVYPVCFEDAKPKDGGDGGGMGGDGGGGEDKQPADEIIDCDEEFDCEAFREKVNQLPPYTEFISGNEIEIITMVFPDLSDLGVGDCHDIEIEFLKAREPIGDSLLIKPTCEGPLEEFACEENKEDKESYSCLFLRVGDCYAIYPWFLGGTEEKWEECDDYLAQNLDPDPIPLASLKQSSGCPAPDDITFFNFAVEDGGWYSFLLVNELPWEKDEFYGDLFKGNDEFWHRYQCTPDEEYKDILMDCGSAPGESINGTAAGTGYLMFDPDVFGSSCSADLKIPAPYGTVAAPEPPSEDEGCILMSSDGSCLD